MESQPEESQTKDTRFSTEIVARQAAEEALREIEENHRLLLQVTPNVVYGLDIPSGAITFLNPLFESITGWAVDDWLGKAFVELVHPDDIPRAMNVFQRICDGKTTEPHELRVLCKDGHYVGGDFTSVPKIKEGRVCGILGISRNITERQQLETALRKSNYTQRAILDGIPDPAWMKNAEGVFLAVNRAWICFIGKDEAAVIGKTGSEIFDPATSAKLCQQDRAVLESRQPLRIEECFPSPQGHTYFDTVLTPLLNEAGEAVGVIGIARDITERKHMGDQFLRNQRMESIGSLASGITHDLNNILGPIMMAASVLRENMPKQTSEELISIIQEAAQRGADVVSQVLTFARGTKGERKPVEPRFLIRQVEHILKEILPKSITFTSTLSEGLWNVTGDLTQLHQVFVNLCVNARDAMPHGGTLRLSAKNCDINPSAAKTHGAKPGRYVRIVVADSGIGIPKEILGKIFDPFFTTKEVGKGTGLGLSTVLGIVKSHGGFVTIDSKVGKGSKFNVFFPATEAPLLPAKPKRKSPLHSGAGEGILIVDDEPSICKMAGTILAEMGYHILSAPSGREALEIYQQQGSAIQAVLTDLAMPGMDGPALIRALKEMNPTTVVIASTGHSSYKEPFAHGGEFFLAKPYNAEQLLTTVHQAVCKAARQRKLRKGQVER